MSIAEVPATDRNARVNRPEQTFAPAPPAYEDPSAQTQLLMERAGVKSFFFCGENR